MSTKKIQSKSKAIQNIIDEVSDGERDKSNSRDSQVLKGYYVVEKILDKKWSEQEKVWKYKIKWMNYPMSQCTWEPKTNLFNVPLMIRDFETDWQAKHRDEKSDSNSKEDKDKKNQKKNSNLQRLKKKSSSNHSSSQENQFSEPEKQIKPKRPLFKKEKQIEKDSDSKESSKKRLKKRTYQELNSSKSSDSDPEPVNKESNSELEDEKIEKRGRQKTTVNLKTAKPIQMIQSQSKPKSNILPKRKKIHLAEDLDKSSDEKSVNSSHNSGMQIEYDKKPTVVSKSQKQEKEFRKKPEFIKKETKKPALTMVQSSVSKSQPQQNNQITPPHKDSKKYPRLNGSFAFGDTAKKVISARPEGDEILCLVEWTKRSDGYTPKPSYQTNSIIKEYDPMLLVNYYEAKIKFNIPKDSAHSLQKEISTDRNEKEIESKENEKEKEKQNEKETEKKERNSFEKFLLQEGLKKNEEKIDRISEIKKIIFEEKEKNLEKEEKIIERELSIAPEEKITENNIFKKSQEKQSINQLLEEIENKKEKNLFNSPTPKIDIANLIAEIEENNKKDDLD